MPVSNGVNGVTGVWLIENSELRYTPVDVGVSDLDGRVQITHGLKAGDHIVAYSKQELSRHSRITIVDRIVDQSVDQRVDATP